MFASDLDFDLWTPEPAAAEQRRARRTSALKTLQKNQEMPRSWEDLVSGAELLGGELQDQLDALRAARKHGRYKRATQAIYRIQLLNNDLRGLARESRAWEASFAGFFD